MMKCTKMRQVVCMSGCWNAVADGVVAESERMSQQRIDLAGMLWRWWTSLWLVSSAQHALSLMDLLSLPWFERLTRYVRPAVGF